MLRKALATALVATTGLAFASQVPAAAADPTAGYWMLDTQGNIFEFGLASKYGPFTPSTGASAVKIETKSDGSGIWVVDSKGKVQAFGSASVFNYVSAPTLNAGESIVTISRTGSGNGFWLTSSEGRTFNYGDAVDVGDVKDQTAGALSAPITDSAPTVAGTGMYAVAADGGVFSMGNAPFHGSTADIKLAAPVRSIVPDPDGEGYWLYAADGGVFSFKATFRGSTADIALAKPIVGMVAYGNGYLQVAQDGGIFTTNGKFEPFTNKEFYGSAVGKTTNSIVSVAAFAPAAPNPSPTLAVSAFSLSGAQVGSNYTAPAVAATGATGTVTWSATGLPAGVAINPSTGVISGKPSCAATAGSGNVTVTATDSTGTASRTVSLATAAIAKNDTGWVGDLKRLTGETVATAYLSRAALSFDGCVVAFESRANYLSLGNAMFGPAGADGNSSRDLPPATLADTVDDHLANDIFVLDRSQGTLRRVTNGSQQSEMPVLSADGRYLAFSTWAPDFQPTGDATPATGGIYLVDLQSNSIQRVHDSPTSDAQTAGVQLDLSANGNRVAFAVPAPKAADALGNDFYNGVYVWDRISGLTTFVTHSRVNSDAFNFWRGGTGESENPSINSDGTVVAFQSAAADLISGGAADTNTVRDVFVWTSNGQGFASGVSAASNKGNASTTGSIVRLTNGSAASEWPTISADGSKVSFVSYANNLGTDADTGVGGTPNNFDGASPDALDVAGNCGGSGRTCTAVFTDDADVLFATRPGATWTTGGTLTQVTNGASGSFLVGLSADGATLVFDSHDPTPAATGGEATTSGLTIFAKNTNAATAPTAMLPYVATGDFAKVRPFISGDARFVVFSSADDNPADSAGASIGTDNNQGAAHPLYQYDFFLFDLNVV